jgi:hypothetical protein
MHGHDAVSNDAGSAWRNPMEGKPRFLLWVLLAGIALRLAWVWQKWGLTAYVPFGEASRVAAAIGRQGAFADSFFDGQGPTAHLLPLVPAIAGGVYALFGVDSALANLLLALWCFAQVFAGFFLLSRFFAMLGIDRGTRRVALALLCLLPVFLCQETVDFRYWEGGLAVCLACLTLMPLVHAEQTGVLTPRTMLLVAGLSALTFFVCPPAGVAVDACWAVFALRRLGLARSAALAALSAAALALLIAPWALRNSEAMGARVILRSNFGLELALANHPDALDPADPVAQFRGRLQAIHPYHGESGRAALKAAGGEIAYANALGRQTWRWIAANPAAFARLTLRHYSQFYFPRPWQFQFSGWSGLGTLRAAIVALVTLAGLCELIAGLRRRRRGYGVLAIYLAVIGLPYAIVQPIPRYTYLGYGMFAFLAAIGVVRWWRRRYAPADGAGWAR